MTISHQSALLGATSVQLEVPLAIRSLLHHDTALFDAFAAALFNTYDAHLRRLASRGIIAPIIGGGGGGDGHSGVPAAQWTKHGHYFDGLGSASEPLRELVLTQLRPKQIRTMLVDLERADRSHVHGKSI